MSPGGPGFDSSRYLFFTNGFSITSAGLQDMLKHYWNTPIGTVRQYDPFGCFNMVFKFIQCCFKMCFIMWGGYWSRIETVITVSTGICIERALGLQLSYDKCWVDLLSVSCFHAVLHIYWEHSWLNIAWLSNTQCTGKETWKHMFPVSSVVKQSGCQLMNSLLKIFRSCTISISPMRQFTLWTFRAPSGQHSVRIWWKIWQL